MRTSLFVVTAFTAAALLASPALAAKHKSSCYDFAWQSQDMKDCIAHPEKASMHHKSMHKPMKKAKAMKGKDMKGKDMKGKDMKDMKSMPEKKS